MTRALRTVEDLVGEELSGVAFVRDYVEFHFDGPVLRAISNPCIASVEGRVIFPAAGSRDALCALIGQRVVGAGVRGEQAIRLEFLGGVVVEVPLDAASRVGPEAAHLMGYPDGMSIW